MYRHSNSHSSLTTVTIRETFRLQRRSQQTQKSFREIRKKMQEQQRQDRLQKEHERLKRLPVCSNLLIGQQKIPQAQVHQHGNQNYHQNLCFNVNIGNVNFHKNAQHFNQPQPFNFNPNGFHFNNLQFNGFNQLFQYAHHFIPNASNLPIIQPSQLNQPNIQPVIKHQPIVQEKKIEPVYEKQQKKGRKPTISNFDQKQYRNIMVRHENFLVYNQILGTGSYSKVYLGMNLVTNEKVAVKQISELEENQIKVLMSIQSPYIIKLQSFWKSSSTNLTYLVLDLCERNLREEIKLGISQSQKLKYFDDVFCGMDVLSSRKIIHRDLKFENILISKDKVAKITDFGLAKDMGSMSNVASLRCGTPYTMAPEIFFHNGYGRPYYNQKCDIWSLAVILHEIIYSRHPFNLETSRMEKMQRVRVQKKYGYLDLLIDRSLVKNPFDRIGWDQFKKIYQCKGQYANIPKPIDVPVPIEEGSNFKKKINGKQMKISQAYQAYSPENQTSLLENIQKRIYKQQMELEQLQNKQINRQLKLDKSKGKPKSNNLISNQINNVVLPNLKENWMDVLGYKDMKRQNDENNEQKGVMDRSFQNRRMVQRPIMPQIQDNNREKRAKLRSQLGNSPKLRKQQVKYIVPGKIFDLDPSKRTKPKQQIVGFQKELRSSYSQDKNLIMPKILFVIILFILLWNLHGLFMK